MILNILEGEVEIEDLHGFLDRIKEISYEYNVVVQVFDANKIAGTWHMKRAVEKAIQSMEAGNNISSDLAMEILLYASGKRQINKAIEMGVSEGRNDVVMVVLGGSEDAIRELKEMIKEKSVLEYSDLKKDEIMRFFEITEDEIEAAGEEKIPDLVIERVVLLDISK